MRAKLKTGNKKATHGGFFVTCLTVLRARAASEWLMLGSFCVYCFVFPWAVLLLSFDWMPFGMEGMSSLLLAMLGLAAAGWLWTNYGQAGLLAGAGIFIVGVAIEYVGITTGVPFGDYKYTGVLLPQLPGGVPVAIGFAWVMVVIAGLYTARWVFPQIRGPRALIFLALVGALLAMGLDLLLEPVAYHIKNYWVWLGDGGYYGIPWSNFITWLVVAFAIGLVLAALLDLDKKLNWKWLPVALFGMNVVLFGVVNAAHDFWIPGVLALLLIVTIAVRGAHNLRQPHEAQHTG